MESTIHATDELEPANRAVYIYEKEIGRTTTGLLHFFLVMKVEGREKKTALVW